MKKPPYLPAALLLSLASTFSATAFAQGVDMGDASVLSQQGQRLKIAVPYGSEPGARVPVLRFQVASVEAGEGQRAPSARSFTVSQPENRNVIYLHSAETVYASNLKLVLAVAGEQAKRYEYDIAVPPAKASMAAAALPQATASQVGPVRKGKARKPRRAVRH